MRKGQATGPQKKARAAPPPPEKAEEGDGTTVRNDDRQRKRIAWDACAVRIQEEAERVQDAALALPQAELLGKVDEIPLPQLRNLEAGLTKLRVQLEQTRDLA